MSSSTDPWQPAEKKTPGDPQRPQVNDDMPAGRIDSANS
jgi:hypothetical protein